MQRTGGVCGFWSERNVGVKVNSIQEVVNKGLCISCGACSAASSLGRVKMQESVPRGMYFPTLSQKSPKWGRGTEFEVCPGKGYEIVEIGKDLFEDALAHDINLGRWIGAWASQATTESLMERASSGGVMTAIADYLLGKNFVQGVVVTRMTYGVGGPRPETIIATSRDELVSSQGSKYCPVPVLEIIHEIKRFHGKVLFIGTPCQIAGLRMLQRSDPTLLDKIPLTVGNFCGGFRDLRETNTLIKRSGLQPAEVTYFRYRGGGQPGTMAIKDTKGRSSFLSYPNYARMTGLAKNKRCRLCVDATAELADFACGDAWIPRFMNSGSPWSLVLTRSSYAEFLLQEMRLSGKLKLAEVTVAEIKKSQHDNLMSKKVRQAPRRRLFRLLGMELPKFESGYFKKTGGMILEARVQISHLFLSVLESLHLYSLFARAIGRYSKDQKK
jgi:coenzyme F420 hydrogenase subunit beta